MQMCMFKYVCTYVRGCQIRRAHVKRLCKLFSEHSDIKIFMLIYLQYRFPEKGENPVNCLKFSEFRQT